MENNYLLESFDSLSLKEEIKNIINKTNFQDIEINHYDLEEQELNEVLEDLDTYGLFSTKKIIVVNNIDSINIDNIKKEYDHLINYLQNSNPDNLLILTSRKLNNTKKITKDLKKYTTYKKIELNSENYIKNELKDYKLESGVIKKLMQDCLDDITKIHNECEKLKNYKYDTKEIKLKDIDDLIIKKQGDITGLTFDFIRFLAEKDKTNMLKTYKELEKNNIEPISILGLLASQLRIIYQVKVLANKNLSNIEIAETLNEKPYRIQKTKELINYYTEEELLKLMQKLADIDLNMKTTDINSKFLLEIFIINW